MDGALANGVGDAQMRTGRGLSPVAAAIEVPCAPPLQESTGYEDTRPSKRGESIPGLDKPESLLVFFCLRVYRQTAAVLKNQFALFSLSTLPPLSPLPLSPFPSLWSLFKAGIGL